MHIQTTIIFERDDSQTRVETVYNLLGIGHLEPVMDRGREIHHPDRRIFNKLRGESIAVSEFEEAKRIVERRLIEMRRSANDPVFSDPKIQSGWRSGIMSTADLAEREWRAFVEDVEEILKC